MLWLVESSKYPLNSIQRDQRCNPGAEPKKSPEKHRGLIVRIAGYGDYFVDLRDELQDEIIR
jgi:autonomous glycyl radical cofactor GrcA